jgi:hypothetical protein
MDSQIILDNLTIVKYRGIHCISTIPLELVWGIEGSVLECGNCIAYASDPKTKVLIGLCVNCAKLTYNCKYGCGYYYDLKGLNASDVPLAFGNLNTNNVVRKLNEIYEKEKETNNDIKYNQNVIYNINNNSSKFIYSIYNLSMLSYFDIRLLMIKINEGWTYFKNYYNSEDEILEIIIDEILAIKKKYDNIPKSKLLFDNDYYKKCNDIEKFYKVELPLPPFDNSEFENENENENINENENENINENAEVNTSLDTIIYNCKYCNIQKNKKEFKKCGDCKKVRYCSIACQERDWKFVHKYECRCDVYSNLLNSLGILTIDNVD